MRILLLMAGVLLCSASVVRSQISVEVVLDQEQYLRDEALPVHVRITNRSGQVLRLGRDNDWLSFAVESTEGLVVARLASVPVAGEFALESASIATREVDLTPCFDIGQPGRYQVTATLRIKEWDKEIPSRPRPFEIVRGTKIWEQEFGVPGQDGVPEARKYVLQQANYRKQLQLYARVTNPTDQRVFRVFTLGPLVSFNQPEAQVDKTGYLHVLFQIGARAFRFCVVSPDGDVVLRQTYDYTATRPVLRANDEGRIFVQGGLRHPTAEDIPPSLGSAKSAVSSPGTGAAPTNSADLSRSKHDPVARKK